MQQFRFLGCAGSILEGKFLGITRQEIGCFNSCIFLTMLFGAERFDNVKRIFAGDH